MPKQLKTEQPTTPTPAAYSVACNGCGAPVSYDEVPKSGAVECSSCGAATVHPEEA